MTVIQFDETRSLGCVRSAVTGVLLVAGTIAYLVFLIGLVGILLPAAAIQSITRSEKSPDEDDDRYMDL